MARRRCPSTSAPSKGPPQEPSGRKGARRESWQPPGPASAAASPLARWEWLLLVALVLSIFFVYQPAWQGGFIWDDDAHVTKPELRSWQGLYRIWFDVQATLQYYPLLHSAFWIEHKLWGDATLGYHLLNLLLHAAAAVLAALILRRLAIPGAYLAAAIFALHPVHAESVAWITEQKNTLSAVFYLGAMLVYLRFDQTRKLALYGWALGLFLLAILSKTVTATLPGGLLVIFWWQRGRLSWKRDVLPLLPLFLLGAGGGLVTAWWELQVNHCVGPEFQFTPVERLLIAGRAVWFHLWKLCWPTRLTFFYPRWQIDSGAWWQYLFPLGLTALLVGLWSIRGRTRAPLAALLFFGGTLFPVLGFFNLYTFRYSLIANHYQYLASLGAITLAAAGAVWLLERWGLWRRPAGYMVCLALLATLAGLSWRQCWMYADLETLYRTTIEENPNCWIAHNNLGMCLLRGQVDDAIAQFHKALEIKPDCELAYNDLGIALAGRGQFDSAIAHYGKVLEIKPDFAEAHNNLGNALAGRGQFDSAIAHYQKALEIKPNYAEAHYNLALTLAGRRQFDLAVDHYRKALEIKPDYAEARYNLGLTLAGRGHLDEAIAQYQQAVEVSPQYFEAHNSLGIALAARGRFDEAMRHYQEAPRIQPDNAEAHYNLGVALSLRGKIDEALAHFQQAVEIKPDYAKAHGHLGDLFAARKNLDQAVRHYLVALRLNPHSVLGHIQLGRVLRRQGKPQEAEVHFREALGEQPSNAEACSALAMALQQQGKTAEAPLLSRVVTSAARSAGCPQ